MKSEKQSAPAPSPLGLGTGRLTSLGTALSRSEATLLIHTAIDHDIHVIDTADTYGSGDTERVIGHALRERRRGDCFLITKAGLPYVALPAIFSPLNQIGKKLLQKVSPHRNFSGPYLMRCLERSLKRLRTDHVDAFLLHAPSHGEPSSESWATLEKIRAKGLSRFTGIATNNPEAVREGLASGQVTLVETSISLAAANGAEISKLCANSSASILANEVLSLRTMSMDQGIAWDAMKRHHGVESVSTVHLLIAYAAAQPGVRTVLIGTKSRSHLVENLEALRYVNNKAALFAEMKEAFA